jgi:DNA polymerase
VPKDGHRFIVSDFSAIEARVLAWYAGENWRIEVFEKGGDIYCASASQMFKIPVEKNGVNGHLRQKGKIAELALGYGGSVGALKAMGAVAMGIPEGELKGLVTAWRGANPMITKFWWAVDRAVKYTVSTKQPYSCYGLTFSYEKGILFIALPSGRRLAYVRPRMGINGFGSDCVTYEGVGATKKWERLESYGPKFVENIVQATARDILVEAMQRLYKLGFNITMHVHDEVVLEVPKGVSNVKECCQIMSINPEWAVGLPLNADGYECEFYKKE